MIAALMLLGYAGAISVLGGRILQRPWTSRAPRSAVIGWQALSTSVVAAILLAAVSLALPFLPLRFSVAWLLGAHSMAIIEHYETPLGVWPGILGLAVVAGLATMLLVTTIRSFVRKRRVRRSQLDSLRLVGHPHPDGFTVIDHQVPIAYCLPGGSGTVVLSSAALELLEARERALVLAHERSHLRARHDLALAYSDALTRTFPWVPLFAVAHDRVATLLEMAADDSATGPGDRRRLANALVTLGTGVRPEAALAASNTATLQRVRRLTADSAPAPRGMGVLITTATAVALSVPIGLALAPAIEAAATDCCTSSSPSAIRS